MAKQVAVILSGCGHRDGAEITEAVSALIAISSLGADYRIFAPDVDLHEVDGLTGERTGKTRNVLLESARIARGEVEPLCKLKAADFDALVFPGGFGAALNLSSWGEKGADCTVNPDAERVILEFYSGQKPIAAICIAPVLVARVLGCEGVTLTIGRDPATVAEIVKTGAHHEVCAVDDYVTDREHRVVSTPAYMYDKATPAQVFTGVRKAIAELIEMA
jgi:enhancing lycopene biosynthesis protein 2